MAGPYAGLKVFDLSHVIAGPFCTRLLADLGADVVRVEQPAGDLMRALPVAVGDPAEHLSSAYAQYNTGKRSIGLDLKDPRGLDLALRLPPPGGRGGGEFFSPPAGPGGGGGG